ncbi:unnamed protein product [Rotaria sp. Silwood2]|nr:unnamed protein product [Rotaria sp. Silwood2]CAF2890634.1 unnamed protein product [Rotaria sp. Silwood2]CAF3408661.1 unnamed protein product [Rotaria sp. Silwood2]CAF3959895.1 unnamed protein product [Rotaria sp. Silwood2]CAF3962975.1 unnamed protein product [Rotaria sp. Silwood2]
MVVQAAARGIVEEGKILDNLVEGGKLSGMLLNHKNGAIEEVVQCCAHLHTLESFLYKSLTESMRLVENEDETNKGIWYSKVPTWRPFALLLNLAFTYNASTNKVALYRGANLLEDRIDSFRANVGKERSFHAFTSVSRNRNAAAELANCLFMFDGSYSHFDVSQYSEYPQEEEELLPPGLCCRIDRVLFDATDQNPFDLLY